jgi:hypothetical protein
MRNKFTLARFYHVAIAAIMVAFTTQAAPTDQIHWKDLAAHLKDKLVTITTKDGTKVSGRLAVVRPDGISLNDGYPRNVPRDSVVSLHWEAPYQSQTRKLGKMLATGYRHSGRLLGTPMGPFGLVELPAITAWGAAAAPFCLLGDLFAGHPPTSGDILILPDPSSAVSK